MTIRFAYGWKEQTFLLKVRGSVCAVAGLDETRISESFRIVLAFAVLVAVATVLIAPSIDMPETALREHHITSHSIEGHSSGNLTVEGKTAPSQSYLNPPAIRNSEHPELLNRGHKQSFTVLRC